MSLGGVGEQRSGTFQARGLRSCLLAQEGMRLNERSLGFDQQHAQAQGRGCCLFESCGQKGQEQVQTGENANTAKSLFGI